MVLNADMQSETVNIPKTWQTKTLGDLCYSITDGTHYTPKYADDGIPFYSVENVTADNFVSTKFITAEEHSKLIKRCKPEKGDILLTRIGSLGDTKLIDWDVNASIYVSLALLKPNNEVVLPAYLYAYTKSRQFVMDVEKRSLVNATPKKINMGDIAGIPIMLPPPPEQEAIATALSDVDELITKLDQFITKKYYLKQAVMQQLLTGKTRLAGFNGEWGSKTFEECFEFLSTGSNSRSELAEFGDTKYIHYGDIHTKWSLVLDCETDDIPFIDGVKVKNLPLLVDGDLVLADASEDYEGIGSSIEVRNVNGQRVVAGLHTLLLRGDKTKVADGYKAYITSIESVKQSLIKIATGISVFGISKSNLKTIEIPLPPTVEEQQAIAMVLSDMDNEVRTLEQQRDKTRALKQGMLQELLSGKTRLI
jgi:type I restriction enzyme S subunit